MNYKFIKLISINDIYIYIQFEDFLFFSKWLIKIIEI